MTMHRLMVNFKLPMGALRRHRFYNLSWEHPSRVSLETQESSQASYLQLLVQTQHACYLTMESAQKQNREPTFVNNINQNAKANI